MKKYCVKCGKPFDAVGREVICPACKAQAAEETKRAAVLRAKRASWAGESVPVRISGRASTLIRKHGEEHNMSFAESLDSLLQSTGFFKNLGVEWNTVQPYKSRRRDKHATQDEQEVKTADKQDAPQASKPQASKPQEASQTAQAAKTSKTTSKKASSTSSSKSSSTKKG